eukprot:Em0016g959a
MADRARLLSVSASHAASWLSVTPSLALGLHLEPNELHASIRWWLGLDTSGGSLCPVCSQKALDPLGHHATTHGGDVVTRHNLLRDVVANLFRQAHMGVTVEAGYGLTHDNSRSRPADVLVTRWEKAGVAAVAAESRKYVANDPKCTELGWTCVPLAVETYGNWGVEAQETFSRLASLLAASHSVSKSKATADIYGCLNLTLTSISLGLAVVQGSYPWVYILISVHLDYQPRQELSRAQIAHFKNGCPFQKKPKEATLHMEAKHLLETERVDKHSNPDIVGDERTLEKFLTQMASIRSQQTAEKTYEMQTLYGLKAVDNPMLSIGFNPFMGTPLEVLHTILLGLAKYMLKQFMPQMTNRMKEEVLAHVNAFPHSGLHSKMFGNVCRYYNSFVGRDLKGWSQMSVFISSPYLSSDDRKVLLSFSKVFRIAYCNYFSPHLYHEWKSICENFVINVKHTMPELLNKPKVHLILHLVDCMVNLGPCSAFSAERCECFNATVRAQNIFSNCLAPSRDIYYVTMRELHGDRSMYQPGALRNALQHVVLNTIGLSCATIEDLHRHDSSTTIERFHCMEDSLVAVFKGIIAAEGRLVHAGDFVELLCSETKYALFLTSCQLETGESFCVLQGYDEFVVNRSDSLVNENILPLDQECNLAVHSCPPDAHESDMSALCFSPDGTCLATGGSDKVVKVWTLRPDILLGNTTVVIATRELYIFKVLIPSVQFCPAAKPALCPYSLIPSASSSWLPQTIILLAYGAYPRGGPSTFWKDIRAKVLCAKFIADETHKMVTGSHDRTLKIWDLSQKSCIRTLFAGSSCNDIIAGKGMGTSIISGHLDKRIRFWDARGNAAASEIALPGKVTSFDHNPDRQLLLCCSRDDTLRLIELRQNSIMSTFSTSGFKVSEDWSRACFSPDGQYVAAGSADGSVFVWEVASGRMKSKKEHMGSSVVVCGWHPSGQLFASGDRSKKIILWKR